MNRTFRSAVAAFMAALLALSGCSRYEPPAEQKTFQNEDIGYCFVAVLDFSGSYLQHAIDGKAYTALTTMLQKLARDRSGENDRIILGQISAVPTAPIFDGSVRAFRRQFGSAADFKAYLLARSNPAGSRVHDSIVDTINYALPRVAPSTRLGIYLFTDFEDNMSAPGADARLIESFRRAAKLRAAIGCYWVALPEVAKVRSALAAAGVQNSVVESTITADVALPSFD